jgi:bacillithiol system protein YtxJ
MLKIIKLIESIVSVKSRKMNWNILNSIDQLSEIDEKSKGKTQILFKHSTRCSVSTFAKRILESEYSESVADQADVYYLDLISFRDVSGEIANRYNVQHESPQLLVIKEGKCIHHSSHSDVSFEKALA